MLHALVDMHSQILVDSRPVKVSHAFYSHVTLLPDHTMSFKLVLCMSVQNQNVITARR